MARALRKWRLAETGLAVIANGFLARVNARVERLSFTGTDFVVFVLLILPVPFVLLTLFVISGLFGLLVIHETVANGRFTQADVRVSDLWSSPYTLHRHLRSPRSWTNGSSFV